MKLNALTIAGALAVASVFSLSERSVAQSVIPTIGGVQIQGASGNGLYIPYSGGGVSTTTPYGAYNLRSGNYYTPWSNYGGTTNPYYGSNSYYYPNSYGYGSRYYSPTNSYYPNRGYNYGNNGYRRGWQR